VSEIHGEFLAIDRALEQLRSGDLCLILIDQVEEALAHIEQRVRAAKPARKKKSASGKTAAPSGAQRGRKSRATNGLRTSPGLNLRAP
jgi:cyanophycin synthetase